MKRERIVSNLILFSALLITLAYLLACATVPAPDMPKRTYVEEWTVIKPKFDNSDIKKIGVVKLSNATLRKGIEDNITANIVAYLREKGDYGIVIINETVDGLPTSSLAQKLGKQYGVDAVLFGNLDFYNYDSNTWQEYIKGNAYTSGFIGYYGYIYSKRYGTESHYVTWMKRSVSMTVTYNFINSKTGEVLWTETADGKSWIKGGVDDVSTRDESVFFKGAQEEIITCLKEILNYKMKYRKYI
ncbi:MAG: hypothetical protein JW984_02715 [Deltaproteobacteria bacterium]|uniref:Uncharacterized protein n=1 Tax=Candidatus Zymogenus saltonus TaxID=2844893 RepID=A0A9D8PM27_9DELT|nr:hypothetical protein [Candidatus Zymogenus saltonus]